MKTVAKTMMALALVALMAATVVHARGGGNMPDLTDDERAQVQEIRDSYKGKLDAVRTKLDANNEAMETLMANDDATVGELKKLREERATLQKEKSELRKQSRDEVATKLGIDFDDDRGRGGYDQGKKWRKGTEGKGRYGCDKPCATNPDCPKK